MGAASEETARADTVRPVSLREGAIPPFYSADEMVERIREFEWSETPLGPIEDWPPELGLAVDLMLGAGEAISIYWGEHHILLYNDAWRNFIGDKHPDALGQPAREVFPEIWETIGPRFDYVLEGHGAAFERNQRLTFEREGHLEDTWFDYSFNPIPMADGSIGGVFNIGTEITERIEAETALRESEARLNAFLEQLPVGAGMVDAEGKWILKNPALDRYVSERTPSQTPSDHARWRSWRADGTLIEPEQWPDKRALQGETVSPGMDFLLTAEDGTERWTRVSATPFRGSGGEIKGAIIVAQDIHERKQAEEALRRSEEFHRLAAEAGNMGTWSVDLGTGDAALSPRMAELMGYAPDEYEAVQGQPEPKHWQLRVPQEAWMASVHPDDRAALEQAITAARENDEPLDLEFRVQHEGGIRWLYAKGKVRDDGPEEIRHLRGVSVDITRRRELEEALVGASETVRQDIGRELHDVLSSDLAALAMKADNLARTVRQADSASGDSLSEQMGEALEEIAEGVRSATKQTRNLSHVLMPAALQEEHLAAALEHLCREQAELGEPVPTFEGDREESLPKSNETAMHLYRIAREAITNAQRHAGAEHIWVRLHREDGRLVLTVRDDGDGLADKTDRRDGIGLRTMEHRADLIGASFAIEPSEEGGTMVRCMLPLSEAGGA